MENPIGPVENENRAVQRIEKLESVDFIGN
jgi:hypothetical protein